MGIRLCRSRVAANPPSSETREPVTSVGRPDLLGLVVWSPVYWSTLRRASRRLQGSTAVFTTTARQGTGLLYAAGLAACVVALVLGIHVFALISLAWMAGVTTSGSV